MIKILGFSEQLYKEFPFNFWCYRGQLVSLWQIDCSKITGLIDVKGLVCYDSIHEIGKHEAVKCNWISTMFHFEARPPLGSTNQVMGDTWGFWYNYNVVRCMSKVDPWYGRTVAIYLPYRILIHWIFSQILQPSIPRFDEIQGVGKQFCYNESFYKSNANWKETCTLHWLILKKHSIMLNCKKYMKLWRDLEQHNDWSVANFLINETAMIKIVVAKE